MALLFMTLSRANSFMRLFTIALISSFERGVVLADEGSLNCVQVSGQVYCLYLVGCSLLFEAVNLSESRTFRACSLSTHDKRMVL